MNYTININRIISIILVIINISMVSSAQNIPPSAFGKPLPYTWQYQTPTGIMICTLNTDGSMTTITTFPCSCYNGCCKVCGGTGMQYWYGMGYQPCLNCIGGRCPYCQGKGYQIISSITSPSGATIGYSENGKYYYATTEKKNTAEHSSGYGQKGCSYCGNTGRVIRTDGLAFGLRYIYCDECKKTVLEGHYHTTCPICKGKSGK